MIKEGMSQQKPFWKNGIQFECQGSGKCCTSRGTYGYIYLSPADRKRLAANLEMKESAFTQKYCETTDGWVHLKDPKLDCVFLEGSRCSVYEGRPTQCRTWPFWPENMNPRAWKRDVVNFCPGIGKGKLYTPEEIQEILEVELASNQSVKE
jgi:uncharacterized protein